MYEDLAKKLKQNIEIMTPTFEKNNLQIINTGMRRVGSDDGDFDFLMEITSLKGSSIKRNLYVNLNLYNSDGEIILHESRLIDCETFQGYETVAIFCSLDGEALPLAAKGRVYCSM